MVDKSNFGQTSSFQTLQNARNKKGVSANFKVKDIPSKFSKTIKIESLVAIVVLLAASLLTITSPPGMNMSSSSAMSSMPSSSASTGSMSGMSGMHMTPTKNSTHIVQRK